MKKLITLSLAAFMAFQVSAQSTRMILAEEFTNASCPPCASQNPAFNTLLNNNGTKVVAIKYQTNWPGADPMNAHTQSIVGPRVSYYGVTGVPHALMDGVSQTGASYTGAPANWSQAKINAQALIASPYDLAVAHSFSADHDSIFVTVDINCTQAVSGTLKLHVAVIERVIDFCDAPGTNGEEEFEGVMVAMLPGVSGTDLAASWSPGQMQTENFSVKLPNYLYDKNELAVVAFIQDNSTKAVHQAAYSAPQQLSVDARLPCDAITGLPIVSCGTAVNPSLTIQNLGSTPLTSATVNYSYDGMSQSPIAWTGNVIPGGTASVALPNAPTASGSHSVLAYITLPNGQTDLNAYYDNYDASYNTYGTTGGALPLSQNFASTQFPPLDWTINNPDEGYGWVRSTAGYLGGGSAKINFYSSPNGQIDELWTANYDFSTPGITTATLEFDVAYSQYTTQNDRIEVLYSTNCGTTWTSVYNEAGSVLASGNPAYSSGSWTPSSASSWHHKTANLNGAVGNSSVFVKFKATSNYGNNAYVDNINVNTNLSTGIPSLYQAGEFNVFPNPSTGVFQLQYAGNDANDIHVVVVNALGAVVRDVVMPYNAAGSYTLDLSNEAKGSYQVSMKSDKASFTKRVTITE